MSPTRKSVGHYEIERELGQGGMGVVYLAQQPDIERLVVLKTLRREMVGDAAAEERFRREAKAAAGVHHQNVVGLYDCFTWRGERWIAQEYVDGQDLASVLRLARRIEPRVAALVALELARGLEEIHASGVVHRDLKPSNVLLGRAGQVKIADFGIALDGKGPALTQTGHAVGTPVYMSPEALMGERADSRSDLFPFGTLLYEMLTGELPFADEEEGPSLLRRMESERYVLPRRRAPETPRWLAGLVRRCLRAKPRRRPASATEIRRLLEERLGGAPPAETRREIALWLGQRGVFAESDDATRAQAPISLPRRHRLHASVGWAAAAAALAVAFAAAGTSVIDVDPQPLLSLLVEARTGR